MTEPDRSDHKINKSVSKNTLQRLYLRNDLFDYSDYFYDKSTYIELTNEPLYKKVPHLQTREK